MSTAKVSAGQKRKAPNASQASSSNVRKRQKFQDARNIPTQGADAALSRAGELNIASFVKAREYEIGALDKSMKRARKSLSTRAFQQVPRHLRRRTASHNAKKVPRRLRGRARQEMIEDNTPLVSSRTRKPTSHLRLRLETAKALKKLTLKRKTVRQKKREAKLNKNETDPSKQVDVVRIPRIRKNKLSQPPLATSKFKRRQVGKTWLPTHLWHTKRAHMTRPTEPLWRMAIPLRPTEKSYRATHRASESRGCVVWDTSYISTLACRGTDKTLENLLRLFKFHGNGWTGQRHAKWKAGSRFASGWICKPGSNEALSMVDVLWLLLHEDKRDGGSSTVPVSTNDDTMSTTSGPKRQKAKLNRKIVFRIHPSAFYEFWKELLQAAKLQKPQVLLEDLRFEIGSIEVIGPGAAEAFASTLQPSTPDREFQDFWRRLLPLTNPALLPLNAILSFKVHDPRLTHGAKRTTLPRNETSETALHELITEWPFDSSNTSSPLFSHKARYLAGKLPSQWALSRRREDVLPGQQLQATPKDPSIPIVLLAHRPSGKANQQQGTWTLLAPWKCIDVIWRKMLYCKLSSGSKPIFGGLREQQQVAFEQRAPWFPADFPGTEAGKAWERSQAEKRFDNWIRRPPSRRIAWEKIDLGLERRGELGRGWACDWEYLLTDTPSETQFHSKPTSKQVEGPASTTASKAQPILTQRQRKAAKTQAQAKETIEAGSRNTSSPETDEPLDYNSPDEPKFTHVFPAVARSLLQHSDRNLPSSPVLASVRITYLTKGTPHSAARIYRLPIFALKSHAQLEADRTTKASISQPRPSSDTPPAAQRSPQDLSKRHNLINANKSLDIRTRWLSLDPRVAPGKTSLPVKKDRLNHRGLPRKPQYHVTESLRHINVIPKDAPPEVYDEYGPKPLSKEEKIVLSEQEFAIRVKEQRVWDIHVPCPDATDLIGFVTSAGYNLAEGRGTAIGSIWLQRVLQGWDLEAKTTPSCVTTSGSNQTSKQQQMKTKEGKDRERYLCVVRNAGESIGRLATWELCE